MRAGGRQGIDGSAAELSDDTQRKSHPRENWNGLSGSFNGKKIRIDLAISVLDIIPSLHLCIPTEKESSVLPISIALWPRCCCLGAPMGLILVPFPCSDKLPSIHETQGSVVLPHNNPCFMMRSHPISPSCYMSEKYYPFNLPPMWAHKETSGPDISVHFALCLWVNLVKC